MQDVFKTDGPENGIFDIPDICGQTNSFFKEIPKTQARCDFENGGGWTVILKRKKDVPQQENFNRTWADYERGFGDLNTEFWYGLRNIHCLTEREEMELQVEVQQDDGTTQVWTYGYFEIDGPETNYTLHIGQAKGPSIVVKTVWLITMECSFQPKIGIMISTPTQTVQTATLVEDGGTKTVYIQF